jgi:hypothetical protein
MANVASPSIRNRLAPGDRISPFISPGGSRHDMEVTRDELERAMGDLDRKLALSDVKFEKYAGDLLERAVKGLRRSR